MALMRIPVKKAPGQFVEFDPNELPLEMYQQMLEAGAIDFVNRRMTKIKTPKAQSELDEGEREAQQAEAMRIAQENLAAIMANKFNARSKTSASANKIPREVNTEAMRLARNTIRDELKRKNIRISSVKASDITATAKDMLAADPSFYEEAKANLEAAKAQPKQVSILTSEKLDSLVSPELVKKQAEKAAKAKAQSGEIMSAARAGIVKGRRKSQELHS